MMARVANQYLWQDGNLLIVGGDGVAILPLSLDGLKRRFRLAWAVWQGRAHVVRFGPPTTTQRPEAPAAAKVVAKSRPGRR